MNNHSKDVGTDDDEIQLGKVNLSSEEEHILPPTSTTDKIDTDSDISTDSSTSGKQFKGPHTMLKDSPSKGPERHRSIGPTVSQSQDQAEHYQRLLQEAEHSVSCRDVLISMLQQQLRKIENLYKQSLDDTEDIRYKYCVTTQELSKLRTISEKYREDIEMLIREKTECCSTKQLQKLQNEADEWRSQYGRLLKEVKALESQVKTLPEKVSAEIQVELGQDEESKIDADTLKDCYNSIKNSVQEQNEKMELQIKKLQEDLLQSENARQKLEQTLTDSEHQLVKMTGQACTIGTCTEKLRMDNEQLKKELDKLQAENEKLANSGTFRCMVNEEPSRLLHTQELRNSQLKLQAKNLKHELDSLIAEIQILKEKKGQLQSEVDELNKLRILNNRLGASSDQENKQMPKTSSKCVCYPTEIDQNDNDSLNISSKPDSGVNFTVSSGHLQTELLKLQKENSELKLKIKKMQGEDRLSDEIEKHTVEIVNLRRLIKQKEEEIDRLQHETETNTNRKNEIIQELQTRNELLKSDYEELLLANVGLKKDLTEKTSDLAKQQASIQSLNSENDKLKTEADSRGCPTVIQENMRIAKELNEKIKQLDTATNDLNRQTTDIIAKRALIQTLYAEIEKLKSDNKNAEDFHKLTEENIKIKDELNHKTKQLDAVTSDLQTKTSEIIKKDARIDKLNSEVETLRRKLDDNADYEKVIQENRKIKDDLDKKSRELKENQMEMQHLHTKVEELKAKLAESENENRNYNQELQCHANCISKIRNLETELSEATSLVDKLKRENDDLKSQIDTMTNILQQFKEEAEFKKLENEKLRKKDEQLGCALTCIRRNSENTAQEHSKEMEKTKTKLSEITNEFNSFKQENQKKLNKLNKENEELTQFLQQKTDELKKIQDEFNQVTLELENVKCRHRKDLSIHDRSLDEIKYLYKNKEDELASIATELNGQEQVLHNLEEENKRLRELLAQQQILLEKIQKQENDENVCPGKAQQLYQAMELKRLEENYNKEKIKNSELNNFVKDIRKDLNNLKAQLQDLLKNLECKLRKLKTDIENKNCGTHVSKKGLCEMLDCIGKFKNNMLQQNPCSELRKNSKSSEEKENYSYYYDDVKLDNVKINQNLQTSAYTITVNKSTHTTTKSIQNPSTCNNININKNKADYGQDFSNIGVTELHIKREYLLKRITSIDKKLNTTGGSNSDNQVTKVLTLKRVLSSESYLTSHTKINDKRVCCSQPNETEVQELLFKRKHYSEKVDLIEEALKINKENKQNQTSNTDNDQNKCSSMSAYWRKNLEIMQQMASDIKAMKVGLTAREEFYSGCLQNKCGKNSANHKCSYNASLQAHIADLQEQLRATCLMTKEIDALEYQLKTQHAQLKEFQELTQLGRFTHNSCQTQPCTSTRKEKTNDYGLPKKVYREEEEHLEKHKPVDETGLMKKCPQYLSPKPLSVQPVGNTTPRTCCNVSNQVKQEKCENTIELHTNSNSQTKKIPTAIPKLVQNMNKTPKCRCPSISPQQNKSKLEDCTMNHQKPKSIEHNHPNCGIKTLYQRSQLQTECKGTSLPSCICIKTYPHHPPTSQLPITSVPLKNNCNCVCTNRKDAFTPERK